MTSRQRTLAFLILSVITFTILAGERFTNNRIVQDPYLITNKYSVGMVVTNVFTISNNPYSGQVPLFIISNDWVRFPDGGCIARVTDEQWKLLTNACSELIQTNTLTIYGKKKL